MIARARVIHHSGTPMPLESANILSYLELHDAPVDLPIFVECITAIDNIFIDDAHKRMSRKAG